MRFGEPYPSLFMPAFGGSGHFHEGRVTVREPRFRYIFADGKFLDVQIDQLLAHLPPAVYNTFRSYFDAVPTRLPPWYDLVPRAIFPGYYAAARQVGQDQYRARIDTWLRNRGAQLLPRLEIEGVEVLWDVNVYKLTQRGLTLEHSTTDRRLARANPRR
jgi:hypothetical protein